MNMTTNLQPGRYWIGDLLHVVDNGAFRAATKDSPDGGAFELDELDGWFHETAFGKGTYEYELLNLDPFKAEGGFCSDSGVIGIVPVALTGSGDRSLGVVVEFKRPVRCAYLNGSFTFSDGLVSLQIFTGDD